jgi:hypothetical protein
MAAVTGAQEEGDVLLPEVDGDPLSGFGAVRSQPRDPANMHVQLTRMHWTRSALGWFLQKVKVRHEWEGDLLVIKVVDAPTRDAEGPYIPRNAVPWDQMAHPMREVNVWSYLNSKMDCPSFDLPTGAAAVGGSCPGAVEGQSISPVRRGVLSSTGQPVDLPRTICNACYVANGPFGYANNQLNQMIRHIWVQGMLNHSVENFVDVMSESLLAMPNKYFAPNARSTPQNILPVRVHSAGDFFSIKYASAWLDIANKVAASGERGSRFRFWAPTRTWVVAGWPQWWQQNLKRLNQENFTVRASAFHFDDPSPGALDGRDARRTKTGMGSTSCHITDKKAAQLRTDFHATREEKARFDWTCPTYSAREGQLKSCSQSPNPMGGMHCRACWIRPDLRIDYPAH